jgi:hypothetical protein
MVENYFTVYTIQMKIVNILDADPKFCLTYLSNIATNILKFMPTNMR